MGKAGAQALAIDSAPEFASNAAAHLQGRQPVELTATRLTELDLTLDWTDQRSLLAS